MSSPCRGSSPLARGLQSPKFTRTNISGIIPARAGFTETGPENSKSSQDHPRSRGVYVSAKSVARLRSGSSPLARGLPRSRYLDWRSVRIIPARAGFTPPLGEVSSTGADHPRSRGVYYWRALRRSSSRGSSPLARGLLLPRTRYRPGDPDHPRSRGVYGLSRRALMTTRGSSPLARGLPTWWRTYDDGEGIIPARAGFTPAGLHHFLVRPDHPRSRGVYRGGLSMSRYGEGSSPLARGLRVRLSLSITRKRIIPARAGFTIQMYVGLFLYWDHPRSRGVY